MRKSARIITALSVTGLAVVAGSAFTGAGLSTSGTASTAQFIGGTVTQNVTGATLSEIKYGFSDGTNTTVNNVTLTFAENLGSRTPVVRLSGSNAEATFNCTVDATLNTTYNCTGSQTGVTSASVTV